MTARYLWLPALAAVFVGCAEGAIGGDDEAIDASAGSDGGAVPDAPVACDPLWRAQRPNHSIDAIAVAGDRVYVAGQRQGEGWVAEMSTCTGATGDSVRVANDGSAGSALAHVIADGGDLFAAGWAVQLADPRQGLYARLTTDPLAVAMVEPLHGSDGEDAVAAIARAGSGELWMVGSANTDTTSSPWGIKGTADGQACGFPGPSPATLGRTVAARGDDVYLFADSQGHALLAHYSDAACPSTGPCACAPDWTATVQIGTASTAVFATAVDADAIYAVGLAGDTGADPSDRFAFAARLDPGDGSVRGTFRWDTTALAEGFTAVALDADAVYVAGASGWDGEPGFTVIDAAALRIPRPLTDASTPSWTSAPQADVIWGLALGEGDDGGVYLGGRAEPDVGVAIRCDKTSGCAE